MYGYILMYLCIDIYPYVHMYMQYMSIYICALDMIMVSHQRRRKYK